MLARVIGVLRHDFKRLGPLSYAPFAMWIALLALGFPVGYHFEVLEIIVPIAAVWWSTLLINENLRPEMREVLYAYPVRLASYGIFLAARALLYYAIVSFIGICVLALAWRVSPFPMYLQLIMQAAFMVGLSFLLMSITHHLGAALAVCVLYALICYRLKELWPEALNIFWGDNLAVTGELLWHSAKKILPLAGVLWLLAHSAFEDFYFLGR